MARSDEQTNIRLPAELKAWIRNKAAEAKRSLNSEILLRLEQSRQQQEAADAKT